MIQAKSPLHVVALLAGTLTAGCGPTSGAVDVLAVSPVDGAPGEYALQTTTLSTVRDLFSGKGDDFEFREGQSVTLATLYDNRLRDDDLDEEDFADLVQSELTSNGFSPDLSYNPIAGRWEAEDFESLVYLSAFDAFETTWAFYRDVIGEDTDATDRRGVISLYAEFVISDATPIPVLSPSDNAAFVTFYDMWMLMPTYEAGGLPPTMNLGVIAHEFQHRVFFKNVYAREPFPYWQKELPTGGEQLVTLDSVLMRGVDEGLSDIFAVGVTGVTSFIETSFQPSSTSMTPVFGDILGLPTITEYLPDVSAARDLDGEFARALTYDLLVDGSDAAVEEKCGKLPGPNDEEFRFDPYCLGTVLASTLWDTAGRDVDVLRTDVLPFVYASLKPLATTIGVYSALAGQDRIAFAPSMLLNAIADAMPATTRARYCDEVSWRFESLYLDGWVGSCR